jgi:hypothetical protein
MIDIAKIWHDAANVGPPVLVKLSEGDLLLRLAFEKINRAWLGEAGKADWRLRWDKSRHYWLAPRSWFETLAKRLIERHGSVWVVQEMDSPRPCNGACMHARGLDCVCGCGGRNHGLGDPGGWAHGVADSGIVEWRGKQYTYRLIKPSGVEFEFEVEEAEQVF